MKHSSISCGRIVTLLQCLKRHTRQCLPSFEESAQDTLHAFLNHNHKPIEKKRERVGSTFRSTFCTVVIKGVSLLKHSTTVNMAIYVVELNM